MKKHRFLCMIVTLILVVAAVAPVTALAYPGDHLFEFNYSDAEDHPEPSHQKEDDEQKWVVTLYDESSNMSRSNILGLKMNRSGDNNVDRWHTFSNHVKHYGIPYQDYVASTDMMFLGKKKMSNHSENLYVTGAYNP